MEESPTIKVYLRRLGLLERSVSSSWVSSILRKTNSSNRICRSACCRIFSFCACSASPINAPSFTGNHSKQPLLCQRLILDRKPGAVVKCRKQGVYTSKIFDWSVVLWKEFRLWKPVTCARAQLRAAAASARLLASPLARPAAVLLTSPARARRTKFCQ